MYPAPMPSDAVAAGSARPAPVRRDGVWILPPLLVLGALFFYPLSLIVGQSFTLDDGSVSLATYLAVLGGPLFLGALWHTVEIALGATAGCIGLGFVLALVLTFVPF